MVHPLFKAVRCLITNVELA